MTEPLWNALERLCRGVEDPEQRGAVAALIRGGAVDLPSLLEHALRHRLLAMVAYLILTEDCGGPDVVGAQVRGEMLGVLLANRRRVDGLSRVAAEVAAQLTAAGVTVAVTKGVVLEPTVYGGLGLRKMMDADLMVHPRDRGRVDGVLRDLGFRNGVYDWREHRIDDLQPAARAVYRLSPDHLPHYLRLEPDRAGVLVVDVANSVTWTASRWQVPMDDVLDELDTVPLLGGTCSVPTLAPTWFFLFTALHLFRESWFLNTVAAGKDMLYKFADLLRLWRLHGRRLAEQMPAVIRTHDLHLPVAWVTEHTDSLFGTKMTAELGLAGVATEDWLASGEGPGGRELRWTGTMRERLLRRDRAAIFRERP